MMVTQKKSAAGNIKIADNVEEHVQALEIIAKTMAVSDDNMFFEIG